MKSRISTLIVFFVFLSHLSFAQKSDSLGTAIYFELVGKGFFSANVDFSIGNKSRLTLGITALDHEFEKENEIDEEYPNSVLPTPSLMYFHLIGRNKHYFEAGLGFSISPVFWKNYSENDSPFSVHGALGYRYHASDKMFFRAGITPFYRVNWAFLPLVGVSLGYSW